MLWLTQEEALDIVRDFGINYTPFEDGLYTLDSVEGTSALLYHAVHALPGGTAAGGAHQRHRPQ